MKKILFFVLLAILISACTTETALPTAAPSNTPTPIPPTETPVPPTPTDTPEPTLTPTPYYVKEGTYGEVEEVDGENITLSENWMDPIIEQYAILTVGEDRTEIAIEENRLVDGEQVHMIHLPYPEFIVDRYGTEHPFIEVDDEFAYYSGEEDVLYKVLIVIPGGDYYGMNALKYDDGSIDLILVSKTDPADIRVLRSLYRDDEYIQMEPLGDSIKLYADGNLLTFRTLEGELVRSEEEQIAWALLDKNAESEPYLKPYEAAWVKEFTGESDGIEVSFTLALSDHVINDPYYPVEDIQMTQDGANAAINAWLKACYYRYGYGTYEEYIELLEHPEGGEILLTVLIQNEDGEWIPEYRYLDPRSGFSTLVAPEYDEMPIILHSKKSYLHESYRVDERGNPIRFHSGYVVSIDESGRLLTVRNLGLFDIYPPHYTIVDVVEETLKSLEETTTLEESDLHDYKGYFEVRNLVLSGSYLYISNICREYKVYDDCRIKLDPTKLVVMQIEDTMEVSWALWEEYENHGGERPYTLIYQELYDIYGD